MTNFKKKISLVVLCLLIACHLSACDKKVKVGKLKVVKTEYSLEHNENKVTVSLNVTGTIKNIGPYDVKRIVVTGRCASCSEVMLAGKWFVTQEVKRPEQKDTISYIVSGAEESFSFKGIAYFFKASPEEQPPSYPKDLEVYVESFETVQD